MTYARHFRPQTQPIPESGQVPNSAGGYAWPVDDWTRLDRFLILGSEGGSYYASEQKLTLENAGAVNRCLAEDPARTVRRIVEISRSGRAPRNSPALLALALAAHFPDLEARAHGLAALPLVARTGTHLFQFLETVQLLRGWGRGLRHAVSRWYANPSSTEVAYQAVKYRQRGGWTHADALRLAHPKPRTQGHQALFKWIVDAEILDGCPDLVRHFLELQEAETEEQVIQALGAHPALSWEMVPGQFLGSAAVWQALLPNLPMTALVRNLGRLTANGTLTTTEGQNVAYTVKRLTDAEGLRRARVHPITLLAALETYRSGHGARGNLTWEPVPRIMSALEEGFYRSFGNVTPTDKRIVLALDVSGSMSSCTIAGIPGLTPRVGSAAMALVTARTEEHHHIVAFSHRMVPFEAEPWQRTSDVLDFVDRTPMGGTDCARPMLWALDHGIEADAFVVYTDSETWAGRIHPAQALQRYRERTGIPAKLIVVGMVSNGFSIADPNDADMLDVVGFDTATPNLISGFISGLDQPALTAPEDDDNL